MSTFSSCHTSPQGVFLVSHLSVHVKETAFQSVTFAGFLQDRELMDNQGFPIGQSDIFREVNRFL